jgi:hypothetical protein
LKVEAEVKGVAAPLGRVLSTSSSPAGVRRDGILSGFSTSCLPAAAEAELFVVPAAPAAGGVRPFDAAGLLFFFFDLLAGMTNFETT